MLRRKGTLSLVGLPPGNFPLPIFDFVLNRKTVRGSIVGTRQDLNESLQFAADRKVKNIYSTGSLDQINTIFERLQTGKIEGRVVMKMNADRSTRKAA
jgi:propanol-preferring alcohol dehydrogenase